MRKRQRVIKSTKSRGIDWLQAIHVSPDPAVVAQIAADYGYDAALERWGWIGERTISRLISEGKKRLRLVGKAEGPHERTHADR